MKRIFSIITLIAILLQFAIPVSAADAELIMMDDFNSFEPGTDYITAGGAYKFGSTPGTVTVKNDDNRGDNYIEIDSANIEPRNSCGVRFIFDKLSGKATCSFDYRRHVNGGHCYMYSNKGSSVSSIFSYVPYYYDKNTNSVSTGGFIPANRWVNVTIVVDCDEDYFDIYLDGYKATDKAEFRSVTADYFTDFRLFNDGQSEAKFNVKNVRIYKGEKLPSLTQFAQENFTPAEAPLLDFADGLNTISTNLPDSYAMFAGYPIAYNAGGYGLICESDRSLAPVYKNGYIYAPAEYVAKALGGSWDVYKGTITKGSVSETFISGKTSAVSPVAPAVIGEVLYIPVCDALASRFDNLVYVDERGLVIFGVSWNPGESVVKPLINELRSRSSVLGLGVNSEVLYSSRSYSSGNDTVWESADAAKRFMGTSNRWTYTNSGTSREKMEDLGHLNQSTINAVPNTPVVDENGKTVTYTYNGKTYTVWEGSAYNIEGNLYIRSDGLGNWGCVNKEVYFQDLLQELKDGIDEGQWLWQFDDYVLNVNYNGGCYCENCIESFRQWLIDNGYDLERLVNGGNMTEADKEWVIANGGMEKFDYGRYLRECRGLDTYAKYCDSKTGISSVPMRVRYQSYNYETVYNFQKRLRAEADAYAKEKGITIHMAGNSSDYPSAMKTDLRLLFYDVLDAGMGETNYLHTQPDAIFGSMLAEQAYGMNYITSLWVKQGRVSMLDWAHVVPLLYATGQNSLIPWDDWIYNSSRWYADLDQLEGNHAFVREYPYLFDNYDTPQKIGYIFDMDQNDGLNNTQIRNTALALSKKGIPFKGIAQRSSTSGPQHSVDTEDFKGVDIAVNVNGVKLSDGEISSKLLRGEDIIAQNGFDGDEFGGKAYTDGTNGAAKYEVVTDPGEAYENEKYLKITAAGKGTTLRYNYIKEGLVKGKEYEISFYAKAAPGETNRVSVMSSNSSPAYNNYYPNYIANNGMDIDDKQWRKVTGTVVVTQHRADDPMKVAAAQKAYNDAIAAGKSEEEANAAKADVLNPEKWLDSIGMHAGIDINNAGTVYIDKFQMKEKADILVDNGHDGQFETATSYTTGSNSVTYSVDIVSAPVTGSRVINVKNSGTSNQPGVRFNALTKGIEIGKTYEISYYAKAVTGSPKTSPFISNSAPATNTLYPVAITSPTVTHSTSGWSKVTGTFKVCAHTPSDAAKIAAAQKAYDDSVAAGKSTAEAQAEKDKVLNPASWVKGPIHAGVNVSGSGQVYIDNVQIREIPNSYTYNANTLTSYNEWEEDNWAARIAGMPDDCFAVLRTHKLDDKAPVVVHAVSYASASKENVQVEINNKYLPAGDTLTVKLYAPRRNPYTKTITKDVSGITTVTIDNLDNWTVLEISGTNTKSIARFDVDGWSGIGLGSRVSYDSASGTGDNFTITTYGEGINRYTQSDEFTGQDEVGFVYKRVETDDFEISGQIDGEGSSGLMIREDVHSNAPSVALVYDSQKGLRIAVRNSTNRAYRYSEISSDAPRYMKLSFKSGIVTAYGSSDNEKWTKLVAEPVVFKPGVAGAFASSPTGGMATCDVSGLTLTGSNSPMAYNINSVNLMAERNPSFVQGAFVDYAKGYNDIFSGSAALVEASEESADGDKKSVKLTERSSGDAGLWYRYVPVENGKTYEASVWMKVDEGAEETGSIIVEFPTAGETLNSIPFRGTVTKTELASETAELSTEWKRVFVRYKISESGNARGINLRIKTTGNSDIYVDNFELKEVHSIGDNINASYIKYANNAIIDLSTSDGSTKNITYALATKKSTDGSNERLSYSEMKHLTISGDTTTIEIPLVNILEISDIYLWETDSMSPIIRQIKIKQ